MGNNEFYLSEIQESMNAMGYVQNEWCSKGFMYNFAKDPILYTFPLTAIQRTSH